MATVLALRAASSCDDGFMHPYRFGAVQNAVTECAIRALVARKQPLVAVLWGRDASTLKPMLAEGDCATIESPHPSPLSASRGFFGSRPFSRVNELLQLRGIDPIDWKLP